LGDDGTTAYTIWARDIDLFSYNNQDNLVLFAATNLSTLKTPENAKNVLAVGASQQAPNQEQHGSGGRGPTSDGRRKPEIYAPGVGIQSSQVNTSCGFFGLTGTSMSSPAVAGAAALVRQYFAEGCILFGGPKRRRC
jgi:serine protease AprX